MKKEEIVDINKLFEEHGIKKESKNIDTQKVVYESNYTSPFTSSGLIREISEHLYQKGKVETHPDWIETLATAIVSLQCGPERFILNNFGKLYATIGAIMIAPSRLGVKTVPLKAAREIVKKLEDRLNKHVYESYDLTREEYTNRLADLNFRLSSRGRGRTPKDLVEEQKLLENVSVNLKHHLFPEEFTEEHLTSLLTRNPRGVILADEYTRMFKAAKTKDYLSGSMEFLSRLLDCDVPIRGTISRGNERVDNPFVSFVSATTPVILQHMKEDFFLQGTGNRLLWIIVDRFDDVIDLESEEADNKINEQINEAPFFWDVIDEEKREKELDNILNHLERIRRLPTGAVMLDFESGIALDRNRISRFERGKALYNEDVIDARASLIAGLSEIEMKLALIHCVGRYAVLDNIETTQMEINMEDYEWAEAKILRHYEHFKKMWDLASQIRAGESKSYSDVAMERIGVYEKVSGNRSYVYFTVDPEKYNKALAKKRLDLDN